MILRDGQTIRQQNEAKVPFTLSEEHLLFWCVFKSGAKAWVSQADAGKIQKTLALILEEIAKESKDNPFQFLKYLYARKGLSTPESLEIEKLVEAELKVKKIKLESKVVRKAPLQGLIEFEGQRLRVEKKIKLMIVDDSKTIRDLLSNLFSKDPEIEVVAVVDHPHTAKTLIPEIKPDVITLDIHMPDMDGVTLLKSYLPQHPIPTIMISSLTMEEGPLVLNALESGAVDYIQKPSFSELALLAPTMIEKIKTASRSAVKVSKGGPKKREVVFTGKIDEKAVILIGSSTGGTEALKEVFSSLPKSIPPILVVQHIPPVFSKAFADRLNQLFPFEVKEAQDGDLVLPDRVLIAPGGFQMELVMTDAKLKVKIVDAPPMNRHKPSVDYLFESSVKFVKKFNFSAAILTGMGADGAKGMKLLHDQKVQTIAQDEETCVVFGMPKEAIKAGGVDFTLPLGDIGAKLMALVKG